MRADLWGDPVKLAFVWADRNPDSPRAQEQAATVLTTAGRRDLALKRINVALEHNADNATLNVQRLVLSCGVRRIGRSDIDKTAEVLRNSYDLYVDMNMETLGRLTGTDRCDGMATGDYVRLVDAALTNPLVKKWPGLRQHVLYLKASIRLAEGDRDAALHNFCLGFKTVPTIEAGLQGVAQLGTRGATPQALALLDLVQATGNSIDNAKQAGSLRQNIMPDLVNYSDEIRRLRSILKGSLEHPAPIRLNTDCQVFPGKLQG